MKIARSFLPEATLSATPPLSWRVLTLFLSAVAIFIVLFLTLGSVSRKETVKGIITSTGGEIRLLAPKSGVAVDIYVRNGQAVRQGQPLVNVSTEEESKSDSFNRQIIAAVDEQLLAAKQRLVSHDISAPIEMNKQRKHIDSEAAQLKVIELSLETNMEKIKVAKATYDRGLRIAEQGIISRLQLQQFQFSYLDEKRAYEDAKLKIAQLNDSIHSDKASLEKLPSEQAQARAAILQDIEGLNERRVSAIGNQGYVLKAKVAGHVTSVQVRRGQTVDTAMPLLTIVPRNSVLYAQVYVPSRAIGFIKIGQKVRIMYDAFPYQRFGAAEGTVAQVSSTVLKPSEVASDVQVTEPVYPVEISLTKSVIGVSGAERPIQPGMALAADFLLEKRSFLMMLLGPIQAVQQRT